MSRVTPAILTVALVVLILVFGGVGLAKGGLYVDLHEGDTSHMVEIIARMLEGQVPHLDFSTPIGIFAFLPVAWLAKAGLGIGQAFVAAQVLVALVLLPVIVRICTSRLSGMVAVAFAALTVTMVLALVHGQDRLAVSVSMYYNRWAWAFAFSAILLAFLPPREGTRAPMMDGVMIGLLFAAMAMSKPTYFVAFFPVAVIALLTRGAVRDVAVTLATGGVVAGLLAVVYGTDLFHAYIGDLLSVTASDTRAAPSAPLMEVLNGPRFLVVTLTAFLGVIVLRQSAQERAGLLFLLLIPGFVYVTYQNYGNDPKWLILLGILLLAHRPERGRRVMFNWEARNAVVGLAAVAFALILPSVQNMVTSPFRHLAMDTSEHAVQIAGHPETQDVFVDNQRSSVVMVRQVLADDLLEITAYEAAEKSPEPPRFLGEDLPRCSLFTGDAAMNRYIADKLKSAPMNFPPETQFFVADVASMVWMIGGFTPLEGGAPWYYAGTPGIENADAILIPLCPIAVEYQKTALKALEGAGLVLRQPIRDDAFIVYPIVREGE